MTTVPHDPQAFFADYVPATFSRVAQGAPTQTSPGAVVFRVGSLTVALRLNAGRVETATDVPDDTLVQVSLSEADFEPIVVRGAEELERLASRDRQLAVLRALSLDAERAALVRAVPGSLAVELTGERTHRLTLTPGNRAPRDVAECTVRCALTDFWGMQRGQTNPFELMMNGKIQITGDAQVVMALSPLFV